MTMADTDYVAEIGGGATEPGAEGRFYGKYRGTVVSNVDPLGIGRIQVFVPDVAAVLPSSWAMPCVPIAGIQSGTWMVPGPGSGVWIEFEQGDPDYPIWVGGFWGSVSDIPALAVAGVPASPSIVMQTQLHNTIAISDAPGPAGGIVLKSRTGASIMVNDVGITIQNGKGASIVLNGPQVAVNISALVVT
jgi:uncharacterized protein involved in type VI secretion and phage assembly